MKHLETLRTLIENTANHNEAAEKLLREIMASAAMKAPTHQLVKIATFFADVIYPEADRESAMEN